MFWYLYVLYKKFFVYLRRVRVVGYRMTTLTAKFVWIVILLGMHLLIIFVACVIRSCSKLYLGFNYCLILFHRAIQLEDERNQNTDLAHIEGKCIFVSSNIYPQCIVYYQLVIFGVGDLLTGTIVWIG